MKGNHRSDAPVPARENPRYFRVFRSGSRLYKEIEIFRGCLVPCKFGANIIAASRSICARSLGERRKNA